MKNSKSTKLYAIVLFTIIVQVISVYISPEPEQEQELTEAIDNDKANSLASLEKDIEVKY